MDSTATVRTTRRSASYGELRSSSSLRSRPPPRTPFHKPLRRVNENVGFLASPGPLESMLKTTTETGDIGIFSIGPHLPQSHTFHQLPRSRTGISERNRPRGSESGWSERRVFQDDRRRLPSYRDTTSEILSMYGSESQRSGGSSLPRRFDGVEPRSYSMTSYGSRQALYTRPNGTVSPHLSSGLQRPRSPFPYPTRLKRPGVRPSSPALTENGGVDYSRMVGIDRVSYRTVHGSYKPFYTATPRRPHRPSFRSDRSSPIRPAHSFSTYPTRHLRDSLPSQHLTPSWEPSGNFRDRVGSSSSYQSIRTSSLTSIYDNYRGSPLASQQPQVPEPSGPFYYDYTEGFEDAQECMALPPSPLAPASTHTPVSTLVPVPKLEVPVPRRGLGTRRPVVLQEDCDARISSSDDVQQSTPTPGPGRRPQIASLTRRETTWNTGSREGNFEPFINYKEPEQFPVASSSGKPLAASTSASPNFFLPRHHETYLSLNTGKTLGEASASFRSDRILFSEELSAASKSPERYVEIQSPGKTTIRSVQATILGLDDQQSTRTSSLSTIMDKDGGAGSDNISADDAVLGALDLLAACGSNEVAATNGAAGSDVDHGRVGNRKAYSVEPGLSDLASLVKTFDRVSSSPASTEQSIADADLKPYEDPISVHPGTTEEPVSPASSNYDNEASTSPSISLEISEHVLSDGYKSLLRRHRRHQDEFRNNTVNGVGENAESDGISPARRDTPMLAPKPLSPAKELRLQNSIPQLMKSLPPLPAEQTDSADEVEAPITYSAMQVASPSTPAPFHGESESLTMDILGLKDRPDVLQRAAVLNHSPKFKVRVKNSACTSNGTLESRPWNKDKNYPWIKKSTDIKLASDSPRLRASKPRLRLKRSRNALAVDSKEESGTVKRGTGYGMPTTISEISRGQSRDLFSSPAAGVRMFPRPPSLLSSREGTTTPGIDSLRSESRLFAGSQGHGDSSALSPRAGSLDTHMATDWMPRLETGERGQLFYSERGNTGKRRALRQKFSNLRKKVEGSPLKQIDSLRGSTTVRDAEQIGLAVTGTPISSADTSGGLASRQKDAAMPTPKAALGGRIRRSLSRWMDGAKHAVRTCVAKRRGRASSILQNQ